MTSADPIAAYLASKQPSSAAPTPTVPTTQSDDPIGAYLASKKAPATGVPATPSQPSAVSDDPIGAYLQSKSRTAAPQPTGLSSQPDTVGATNQGPVLAEDRLGTDLPWWNRPIQTYLGFGQYREGAGPIEKGVEKFASGMLTPLNIGLMVATGGLGSLAEGAGLAAAEGVLGPEVIAGLKATGWTGEAAEGAVKTLVSQGWKQDAAITALKGLSEPGMAASTAQNLVKSLAPASAQTVMKGARVAAQMANAKFTYDQIAGLAHSVPAVADAIREGDSDKAIELGTEALLGGAMAAMSGYHLTHSAIKEGVFGLHPFDVDEKGNYVVSPKNSLLQEQQYGEFLGRQKASEFIKETKPLADDVAGRRGAFIAAEADNSPEKLEQQIAGIKANDAIPDEPKAKFLELLQDALDVVRGKPEFVNLADRVRKEILPEKWRENIDAGRVKEAQADNPNLGSENYVGKHEYEQNKENSEFVGTGGRIKPDHLKARTFPTYYDAMMATDEDGNWLGLVPKNPDIINDTAKYLLEHHSTLGQYKSVQKGFAAQVPEGGKLIVRDRELHPVANAPEEKVYLKPDQAVQSTGQPEDGAADQPLTAKRPDALGFYRKAEDVAEEKLPNSGSGEAFLSTLKNAGVKPEELKWTGLEEFLSGKKRVTKQEILDHLRGEGAVRVQEVVKGEPLAANPPLPSHLEVIKDSDGVYRVYDKNGEGRDLDMPGMFKGLAYGDTEAAAIEDYNNGYNQKAEKDFPKFDSPNYKTPGGKPGSYRELLLTLPEKRPSEIQKVTFDDLAQKNPKLAKDLDEEFFLYADRRLTPEERDVELNNVLYHAAHGGRSIVEPETAEAVAKTYPQEVASNAAHKLPSEINFRGGHWDEPNVLAHVRFDERTDAAGKKTLHVAEIQSDWGQLLRKQQVAVAKAIETRFDFITKKMKEDGLIEVDCS